MQQENLMEKVEFEILKNNELEIEINSPIIVIDDKKNEEINKVENE